MTLTLSRDPKLGDPIEHCLRDSIHRPTRRIQNSGILGRHQRCDRALGIPPVAILYVPRKGRETNIYTLLLQLLMAPFCPLPGGRGKEYLEVRIRKDMGPHIAAVCDETRWLPKALLQLQKSIPYRLQHGHGRRPGTALFSANCAGHVLPVQADLLLAAFVAAEPHVQPPRKFDQALDIAERYALAVGCQRDKPVQGAAIEQMPAQSVRHAAGDRTFSRADRPIDRHYGDIGLSVHAAASATIDISIPSDAMQSEKPGNDVSTAAVSLTITGAFATLAATASAIAMR